MCSNEEPLTALAAAVDALAGQDLAALPDPALAGRVLQLRTLLERAEGQWLAALAAGQIAYEHAAAITRGLADLSAELAAAAEPVALGLARRLDPAATRQAVAHLRYALDPDSEDERARRRHERRGLHLNPTLDGMVALNGLLDPEAGETVQAAITALARPAAPDDERSAAQRLADALTELARRALDVGDLPESGGARPHIGVVIDWPALLGLAGGAGGEFSRGGLVSPVVARRLACDAALTRIIVGRDPDLPEQPEHADHADQPENPGGEHTR